MLHLKALAIAPDVRQAAFLASEPAEVGKPALDPGRRFIQLQQGVGAVVELVAAAALASARLGGQQRPASAILLIEVEGRHGGLGDLLGEDLVALLVREEAVEQHQRIGGGQLFAGD